MTPATAGTTIDAPATRVATLRGALVERSALDVTTREAMFTLLTAHFAGVDREVFARDLDEKTAAILLRDTAGSLRGFSTLLVYPSTAAGRPVTVVYSGDTIVDRAWWGSPALAQAWLGAVRRLAAGGGEVYWLLITSGFRTYRFLPVFFRQFLPRPGAPAAAADTALLTALARERFGDRFDAAAGVVRFPRPQRLVADLLDVPSGRAVDPHVGYFLARNPGHIAGDELVCLTRIHDDNLTAAGRRIARHLERG